MKARHGRGLLRRGVETHSLGQRAEIVADGHDTLLDARKHPRLPDSRLWYHCRLLKIGGRLHLDLGRSPIILWNDTGRVGGAAPAAGALGLRQTAVGTWRHLRIWRLTPQRKPRWPDADFP